MSASTRLTDQQRAILEAAGCSVAVSAGAGCGKTFVLTQRFIGHLRSAVGRPDPLGSIVAITFTDRAAREMRHRVRLACEAELKACPAEHANYWLDVLRGLDGARISTIHAFCSNLLRRFAVDAGLDPTFGQLDASFGNTFIRRSLREAFCRLLENNDPDATELVIRFEFERAEALLRDLTADLQTIDAALFDDMTPTDLARHWQQVWETEGRPRLVAEFHESPEARAVIQLLTANEPAHSEMQQRRALILQYFADDSRSATSETLKTLREAAQVRGGGGKSVWDEESIYSDVQNNFTALRKRIDGLLKHFEAAQVDAVPAATFALMAHRVARRVASDYAQRKRNEARLDFDDLLCLARDLLRGNATVQRRAMRGIELLMVDEFQDTDPVQSDLVRLLCGDQLADGRLFLVGDAKQSIYRFRRADPRVFSALRNDLPAAGRLPLTTNFRSQPAILRFVNYTFSSEMTEYEPLVPIDSRQHSPEPSIEFLFSRSTDSKEKVEARREREARWIARRIRALLQDETPRVRDRETGVLRRVRAGDVTILFRALSNIHLYEHALAEEGLDYYLAGGRAFFSQQEVHDLAHLCRWLEDPADELSLAGVLRSPFCGLNDDTLLLLKPERSLRLIDGLHRPPSLEEIQAEQVRRAAQILDELRAHKDFLGIADLLRLAVERTGYDAALLCERLGPRKVANLRKLIALAQSLDEAGGVSLGEFVISLNEAIREQDKEKLAATHPEVADVVRLMTIHQSKGLEFPIVVLADMDGSRRGGDSGGSYDRQLGPIFPLPDEGEGRPPHLGHLLYREEQRLEDEAEQVRLFYVAVTRARDHLVLSAGLQCDAKLQSSWMQLLARRFDLLTGLPPRDPYLGSANGKIQHHAELPCVLVHKEEPSVATGDVGSARETIRLSQFRETVAQAEPTPLPPLSVPLEPDWSMCDEVTVSQICTADRKLAGGIRGQTRMKTQSPYEAIDDADLGGFIGRRTADTARQAGILAHSILEHVDFTGASAADLAALVERSALAIDGSIDAADRRVAIGRVTSFLASPLARELGEAKRLQREIAFRRRWPSRISNRTVELVGTIDCWFEDDRGWHIVDFKAVETLSPQSLEQYRLQLLTYALAIQPSLGKPPASLRIVELGPPVEIHEVPFDETSLDDAARRIDAAINAIHHR